MKRWTGILVSILAVCLSLSALASGVEYDSDGGVWDYNKGTYTTSDGKTVSIIDEDASTKTVRNADGSGSAPHPCRWRSIGLSCWNSRRFLR